MSFGQILIFALEAVFYLLIFRLMFRLFVTYEVLNKRHQFVQRVQGLLDSIFGKITKPIDRLVPENLRETVDISSLVLLVGILLLRMFLRATL